MLPAILLFGQHEQCVDQLVGVFCGDFVVLEDGAVDMNLDDGMACEAADIDIAGAEITSRFEECLGTCAHVEPRTGSL